MSTHSAGLERPAGAMTRTALSLLVLALFCIQEGRAATLMKAIQDPSAVFVREETAASFLRPRRSVKLQREIIAEQTQSLLADKRRTEYREEQIKARENFAEEERSETYEQTREATESWREYHYDGLYPSYRLNRHIPY
ncbi:unique cartilage matrix-associated protein [Lethenteron reissneri]|uniref:unique cartilage matrix-associated protein n=1 Tax=Lethenteron reissneri TaxID=7753 RepID=UPI002AB6274A|nr:unique cartilage matrix-associated protein [Lethenteron reissneri]